jgi:hypothetical protein
MNNKELSNILTSQFNKLVKQDQTKRLKMKKCKKCNINYIFSHNCKN